MGFDTRADQAQARTAKATPAPGAERQGRLGRSEALEQLDQMWGPLPAEPLDWARRQLGVGDGPVSR